MYEQLEAVGSRLDYIDAVLRHVVKALERHGGMQETALTALAAVDRVAEAKRALGWPDGAES